MLHRVQPTERYSSAATPPATPANEESHRISILQHYEILDTAPEAPFERITALAASLFNAPISIIGFLDRDRLWFKSHYGLVETEVERTTVSVISTLNPLIGCEFDPGFFASVPLSTCDGYDIGVLCVIDRQPHQADEYLIRHLKALADIAMDQLELRLSTRRNSGQTDISRPSDPVGAADVKARFGHLTPRQGEILKLVVAGCPSKIIAADLGISRRTVENHRAAIMKRTGATSLAALVQLAVLAAGIGARDLLSLTSLASPALTKIVG
jgi:DNA-binding CsgD family transcriptional regulator